jgi:hypothetical protein
LTLATAFADDKLAGIACRSVHLAFPAPEGTAYYNEVTVEKSAEGTYFCVCGFNQGYFGIQEQGRGRKVVIFSVWDPGKQDDPNSVDPEKRVKLVSKDEQVRVGRFGNEGTGGQSFLDLDWKPGETYRFLVRAKVNGDRTEYSAYIAPPDAKDWRHLATFSTLAKGKLLSGYYAFIEDFKRNKISATIERKAKFGEAWIQTKEGKWLELNKARFTADSNPAKTIDAGVEGDRYFLATGGKVENKHVELNKLMERAPAAKPVDVRPERIPELP